MVIVPFRLFTNLLKCSQLLCSLADDNYSWPSWNSASLPYFSSCQNTELSLAYYQTFSFSILAVDILDHFWMIAFRHQFFFDNSNRQSWHSIIFLDRSNHYSQSAIDNLDHYINWHSQSPIKNLNHNNRHFRSPINNHSNQFLDHESWTHATFDWYGLS